MSETESENGIGHNGATELTEEQKRALLFHHMGKVKVQRQKVTSETGTLRQLLKQAMADGFPKKEIDWALALQGDDDGELVEEFTQQTRIAQWLGHPIGTQFSFDDIPDRSPLTERAFEEGKRSGYLGETCTGEPYTGEVAQEKIRGWHEGQATLMSALDLTKAGMEELAEEEGNGGAAVAAPKKRGRKPKTAPAPIGTEPATHAVIN